MIPMKKVSVLLTIYKESKLWLETSINSLIAQTYKNLEIIVVVDNPLISNDVVDFLDKCKANGQLDYVINENNLGLAASLNIAFSKATGEYIARLDADDYCAPERIQKQVLFLMRMKTLV